MVWLLEASGVGVQDFDRLDDDIRRFFAGGGRISMLKIYWTMGRELECTMKVLQEANLEMFDVLKWTRVW